jgi:hypothetical protein
VSPALVRLAGRGRRTDGALVTWTVAEGRRGRRWRETVVAGGRLVHSLLYETGADGRFSHLELSSPAGLATLHPEGDGTLHGNVVRPDRGLEHVIGQRFAPEAVLLVTGSPIAEAAAAWAAARPGALEAVTLDPATMAVTAGRVQRANLGPVDERGVPFLDDAATWPLEVDDEA